MLSFHLFITSCFPMGVPIEWNVLFVYSMFVLFGHYAELSPLDVLDDPLLAVVLAVGLLVGPVLRQPPARTRSRSCPAMRYYAGNWAAIALAVPQGRGRSALDERITKTAKTIPEQLAVLYDDDTIRADRGQAPGLPLHAPARPGPERGAAPRSVDDLEDYEHQRGRGHRRRGAGLELRRRPPAPRAAAGRGPGRVRLRPGRPAGPDRWSPSPSGKPWVHWRIVDAADGLVEEGRIVVADLLDHQPWPEEGSIDLHAVEPVSDELLVVHHRRRPARRPPPHPAVPAADDPVLPGHRRRRPVDPAEPHRPVPGQLPGLRQGPRHLLPVGRLPLDDPHWTDDRAQRVAAFLWYYRLVGVVAFELTGQRWLLMSSRTPSSTSSSPTRRSASAGTRAG